MRSFKSERQSIAPPARWLVMGAFAVALALLALPHSFQMARRQRVSQTITEITKGNRWAWTQVGSWEMDHLLTREEIAAFDAAMLRYHEGGGEFVTVKGFDRVFTSEADRRLTEFIGHDVFGLSCGLPIHPWRICYPATYVWPAASYIDSLRDAYWAEVLQSFPTEDAVAPLSNEP